MRRHRPAALAVGIAILGPLALCCFADPKVSISATADAAYTQRKFGGEHPKPESYVVMQGHYFEGNIADWSLDRMPFRRIAEIIGPELARQQYWPAKSAKDADLLLVVHWGTTTRPVSMLEMRDETSPFPYDKIQAAVQDKATIIRFAALEQDTDNMSNAAANARTLQLLGYSRFLDRPTLDADKALFYSDVSQERYFIILKAYDLHAATPAARSRAVWTLHLNISSPGNNFQTAVDRMSVAAVDFFGRSTDKVETVRPPLRDGKVEIGPVVSHGEVK